MPDTAITSPRRLVFGIYPGGVAGTESGLAAGLPDQPGRIHEALNALQGDGATLLVRGYVHYEGTGSPTATSYSPHPADVAQYARNGRKVDLVMCFRDSRGDAEGWLDFIRKQIATYGESLAKLQVTEEPNLYHAPGSADGAMPNVRDALVQGVVAAKEEAYRKGLDIQVGFNAVPSFDPNDAFWTDIGTAGTSFFDSLDYVGLDFFPDVFRRIEPPGSLDALHKAVTAVLDHFRNVNLAAGGISPTIPIHITENGWPTGPDRSYELQAKVLETNIRTIQAHADVLNITHYELFSLRDADSSRSDLFYQFGLLRDDYSPKPAFHVFKNLIAQLGVHAQHSLV